MTSEPTTESQLDALWAELLLDACASDGPIRDNDVRQAIQHYRARIEQEAASKAVAEVAAAMEKRLIPGVLYTREFIVGAIREEGRALIASEREP